MVVLSLAFTFFGLSCLWSFWFGVYPPDLFAILESVNFECYARFNGFFVSVSCSYLFPLPMGLQRV